MRVTQEQYERIIGFVGRRSSSSRYGYEEIQQMLSAAARMARKGRFQEAEKLMASLPLEGTLGPAALDLKARICAQQGRFVEAQLCWMEAVRQSPGNETYRNSLSYVSHVMRSNKFLFYRVALEGMVVCNLAVIILLVRLILF